MADFVIEQDLTPVVLTRPSPGPNPFEVSLMTYAKQPWTHRGANLSQWFNYGLNPSTWSAYALAQRRLQK